MTATQNSYKTENQIIADCVSLANTALEYFAIDGWVVRQLRQLYKVNVLNPTIFVSILSHNQLGRQYVKRTMTDDVITRTNSNKQEVKIRFSALHRELETDTTETYGGVDVLKILRGYLQSTEGIATLNDLGYAQYRADAINEQEFMNDSDNFQLMPYYDITLLYTDVWTNSVNKLDRAELKNIYKI